MILVNKEKLDIPQSDRTIGFYGDNLVKTVEFGIAEVIGKDVRIELFIGFNNGTYNVVLLDKTPNTNKYIWKVKAEELFKSGLAYLQIRVSEQSGEVWHSPKATVVVNSSIEEGEIGEISLSVFHQLDKKLNEIYTFIEEFVNITCKDFITESRVEELISEFVTESRVDELIGDFITEPQAKELIAGEINNLLLPLSMRLDGEKANL